MKKKRAKLAAKPAVAVAAKKRQKTSAVTDDWEALYKELPFDN